MTAIAGAARRPVCHTGAVGLGVSCPDFVGRVKELEILDSALESAAGGQPSTVLVTGDAGVGKSRLVNELFERARRVGALISTGVCVQAGDGGLPYAPVVGILRSLLPALGKTPAAPVLGRLVAGVGWEPQPAGDQELSKTQLFEAILRCVTTLAERRVLLLVFEDLHWADSASAELVDFLTRNLAETRVVVVGTYRSDELDGRHPLRRLLAELTRHGGVSQIHLEGLDRDETASLLGGILGHPPDWPLVEAVYARSGGNPFFAEELTATRHASVLSPELQDVIMARADGWDHASEPYHAAYCRWREAEAVLHGRAGRTRAGECLRRAWRQSQELGAAPLRARIEQLARRARIPLIDDEAARTMVPSVANDLGLTRREVEVLGHLAAGRTDRQIAEALFISKKTASVHVSNLLRKLDVASRVEAGEVGQHHGLG